MMKRILLLLVHLYSLTMVAQQPVLEWVKQYPGNGTNVGRSIEADSFGNIYVAGFFEDTINFNAGSTTDDLTTNGGRDIFVSKIDASGAFVWSVSIGVTEASYGTDLSLDSLGNVYLTGSFTGTVDFDPNPNDTFFLEADDGVFILKLNTEGDFLWAIGYDDLWTGTSVEIEVDRESNVYMYGFNECGKNIDVDPGPEIFELGIDGSSYLYLIKLNSEGHFLWAKEIDSFQENNITDVAIDPFNNILLTGYFTGTLDLDPGIGEYIISNQDYVMFMIKLTDNGDFIWGKEIDASNGNPYPKVFPNHIASDQIGNIYTTGSFVGKIDFNTGSNDDDLWSGGSRDIFLMKFDTNGDLIWAIDFASDYGFNIELDKLDNIYLSGRFEGHVDFDPGPAVHSLTDYDGFTYFTLKLSSDGLFKWVRGFAPNTSGAFVSVAIDNANNIYKTGGFNEPLDFDMNEGVYELTPSAIGSGNSDIFILKMNQEPCSAAPFVQSAITSNTVCSGDSVTVLLNVNMPFWVSDSSYLWSTGETQDSISVIVLSDSITVFSVTGTYTFDDNQCTNTSSVEILVSQDSLETPYNGIDDDCNESTFDDDLDQDGFLLSEDCDDNNALVNPNVTEIPYNGIDDDCNEDTPDDDLDNDGFLLENDCDDNNSDINLDAIEIPYNGINDDCKLSTPDDDLDHDNFKLEFDCNDQNPTINPNAEEIPNNGIDEDCDGEDLLSSTSNIAEGQPKIFPNPTKDKLTIVFQKGISGSYTLLSADGKVLLENEFVKEETINVSLFPKGVYILLLQTEDQMFTKRIVKL